MAVSGGSFALLEAQAVSIRPAARARETFLRLSRVLLNIYTSFCSDFKVRKRERTLNLPLSLVIFAEISEVYFKIQKKSGDRGNS